MTSNGHPIYITDLRELSIEIGICIEELLLCANEQGFSHRKDR